MAFASGSGSGSGSSYNFPPISSQGFFTYGGNSPEHSPTNTTQSGHDSDKENLGRARARRFLDEQRVTPNPDATLPTVEEVLDHLAGSVTPSDASSVVSSAGSPSPTTGNPATAHYPSWRSVVLLLSVDQWLTENDVRQWFPAISEENATRYKALFEEFIEYINEYARANDRYRRALQPYEAELRQAQRIRPTNQIEAMNRSIEISTRQAQLSQAAREAAVPRDEDFEELAGEIDPMYIILTSSENDLAAIEDYMTE